MSTFNTLLDAPEHLLAAHDGLRVGGFSVVSVINAQSPRAFDEYRADTLRRLEEEQREFRDFLDRLRHAKDKAEFDRLSCSARR